MFASAAEHYGVIGVLSIICVILGLALGQALRVILHDPTFNLK